MAELRPPVLGSAALSREGSVFEAARAFALAKTFAYARENSEYYRPHLADPVEAGREFDKLRRLPILTKSELTRSFERLHVGNGLPAYIYFSGGGTGTPQLLYGSERELEAIYGGCALDAALDAEDSRGPPGLTLELGGWAQDDAPYLPGRLGLIKVPLRSRSAYEWAWELLNREFRFEGFGPRITQLVLPTPAIKKLVHFILENGLDTSRLALEAISGFSCHLSAGWQRKIEEVLRAPMTDVYGCTEVMAGRAVRAPGQEFHYFDDRVAWEVVDVDTNQGINRGFGKLLLTPLYPYGQTTPMFRYEVGDVVEIGPYDALMQDFGLRPKGRLKHLIRVVDAGRTLFPLFPADIVELIDTHPWVARYEQAHHSGATTTADDAFPRWRLVHDAGDRTTPRVVIEIELKSSPHLFAAEWETFRDGVHEKLVKGNADLALALSKGLMTFEIKALPPGSLRDQDVLVC